MAATVTETLMKADAKAAIDLDGIEVTYDPTGTPAAILAVLQVGPVGPEPLAEGRLVTQRVIIAISKTDVAAPVINDPAVLMQVPGYIWKNSAATVNCRITAKTGDQADVGRWLLELRVK